MNLTLNGNMFFNAKFAFLISILILATLTESSPRILNCRPLPQCCRKYVFALGCRGVSAKRSDYPVLKANDDFQRDPRFLPGDVDYVSNSGYRNPATTISDEDIKRLNQLPKNAAEDNGDYSY